MNQILIRTFSLYTSLGLPILIYVWPFFVVEINKYRYIPTSFFVTYDFLLRSQIMWNSSTGNQATIAPKITYFRWLFHACKIAFLMSFPYLLDLNSFYFFFCRSLWLLEVMVKMPCLGLSTKMPCIMKTQNYYYESLNSLSFAQTQPFLMRDM